MELPRTHAGRLSIPIVLLASLACCIVSVSSTLAQLQYNRKDGTRTETRKPKVTQRKPSSLSDLTLVSGSQPKKCKHEARENSPSYRVGWSTYSVEGPGTLFLAIGIDPGRFTRADLIALARRVKADYCQERRLVVSILDNYNAARAYAPSSEKVWFQRYWRGVYFLDLTSGEEWIEFSTTPDRPRNEVRINLAQIGQGEKKTSSAAIQKH
jgi:hypothetical protein